MSNVLAPPKNISPLIRAGRWTFLLLGMWYGSSKLQALKIKDEPIRKAKIEQATKDHDRALREKAISDKENMLSLAQAAGIKVKSA